MTKWNHKAESGAFTSRNHPALTPRSDPERRYHVLQTATPDHERCYRPLETRRFVMTTMGGY